jgi:hypothetical protein
MISMKLSPLLLTLTALTIVGCASDSNTLTYTDRCLTQDAYKAQLPELVLYGSQAGLVSDYRKTNEPLTSIYSSQIDEATLNIQFDQQSEQLLTRSYQNHYERVLERTYAVTCSDKDSYYGTGFVARKVEGGLLIWEKSSEMTALPNDMWVFYQSGYFPIPPAKLSRSLFKESKGADVAELQRILNLVLNSEKKLTPDGSFGWQTRQAVKDFQKTHELYQDGVVGQQTWEAIISEINKLSSATIK